MLLFYFFDNNPEILAIGTIPPGNTF